MPAVRRRCSHGVHKDRRFYVCGLERSQRCNYFKWSSEVPESAPQFGNESHSFDLFISFQMDLQRIFSENDLHVGICDLVSKQFEKYQAEQADGGFTPERPSSASFPSMKTEMEKMQDKADGVYLTWKNSESPDQCRCDLLMTFPRLSLMEACQSHFCALLCTFSTSSPQQRVQPAGVLTGFLYCVRLSVGTASMPHQRRQLPCGNLRRTCCFVSVEAVRKSFAEFVTIMYYLAFR